MLSDFGTEVPGELCMSNHLSMASIQSIETLHRAGHSNGKLPEFWVLIEVLSINTCSGCELRRLHLRCLIQRLRIVKTGQTRAPGLPAKCPLTGPKTSQTCTTR